MQVKLIIHNTRSGWHWQFWDISGPIQKPVMTGGPSYIDVTMAIFDAGRFAEKDFSVETIIIEINPLIEFPNENRSN